MPLTIAHPAAGYPLRRWLRRSGALEAFVIGSMVPDLPYFLRAGATGQQSHSLAGLVWFCLPAGLVAWCLYRMLFRDVLRALLPASVLARQAGDGGTRPTWRRALLDAAAFVAVGASTHVAWDWFTHQSWVVRSVPVLGAWIGFSPSISLPTYIWLQYLSTVAGLSAIVFWTRRWYRLSPARPVRAVPLGMRALLWAAVIAPGAATALAIGLRALAAAPPQTLRAAHQIVSRALFAGGSVGLASLLAVSVAWWVWCRISGARASM